MTEENQEAPLAPPHIYSRSEVFGMTYPKPIRRERSNKCFLYVLAAVVFLSTSLLIFSLVVMQPRTPDVKLRSVTVKNLRHGNATVPYLNVTLVTELTIKNTNYGPFKFVNTTGRVLYGGIIVGDMKIRHGHVQARKTKKLNVTVDVRSYRLWDTTNNLSVDMNSGMVNLTNYAELRGKIHLLDIVKKKRTAQLNCSMSLNLTSQSIQVLLCN